MNDAAKALKKANADLDVDKVCDILVGRKSDWVKLIIFIPFFDLFAFSLLLLNTSFRKL